MTPDFHNFSPEYIFGFIEQLWMGKSEKYETVLEYQDDYLACCDIEFKGEVVKFLRCGYKIGMAFNFLDSKRAQAYILERIYEYFFIEGCSFAYEWNEKKKVQGIVYNPPKTVYDILGDEICFKLLQFWSEKHSLEEMLTHEDDWQRELANRYAPQLKSN